ncbi:MAG: AAA family ATPase [bacterium]|nr:AAA family ATPase [bacterium]
MILNKTNEIQISKIILNPPNALLISGVKGMGKKYVAQEIARRLLKSDRVKDYRIFVLSPTKSSIGVENVREFLQQLRLKNSDSGVNRVMIIEEAEKLTVEAQNALLKSMEEPPKGTVFLLTSNSSKMLLPTIISRSQEIHLQRLSNSQIGKVIGADPIDRNVILADGRPGFASMSVNGMGDDLEKSILLAKNYTAMKLEDRSILIANIKNREDALELIEGMMIIAPAALKNSIKNGLIVKAKLWHKLAQASFTAKTSIESSNNLKLSLLKFLSDSSV